MQQIGRALKEWLSLFSLIGKDEKFFLPVLKYTASTVYYYTRKFI